MASWYILTLVTEAFGVRGLLGDLVLDPKLVAGQFDQEGKARLVIHFANRDLEIVYSNQSRFDYGDYRIASVGMEGKLIGLTGSSVIIHRDLITSLSPNAMNRIEVELCKRSSE